jgi:copper chaperone CopZ
MTTTVQFEVLGEETIHCAGCESRIAAALGRLPGVEDVQASAARDGRTARAPDPGDIGFGGIVVLRMIFPVDIVSFALGLLKELRFSSYAIASLIGILPFAFAWSYAGGELGAGRFLTFAGTAVGMTVAALVLRAVVAGTP